MRLNTFVCDVCKKQKGETNNWWMVAIDGVFSIFLWNETLLVSDNFLHICGEQCVQKKLSEWMGRTK